MRNACGQFLRQVSISFFLLFSLLSCVAAGSNPEFQQLKKVSHRICNVAIFPFANDTEYSQGGVIFYRIFTAQLIKNSTFNVVQEGDIRKAFRQLKISPKDEPSLEQILIIADRLDLEAVIVGKIMAMEEQQGALQSEPRVAVEIKLLDAQTGNTILTSYKNKSGEEYRKVMHFGLVNTMTELASLVSQEIILKWQDEGVTGCGEL